MDDLIDQTPDAKSWVDVRLRQGSQRFGLVASGIVWTDTFRDNGELVGGDDPSALVDLLNQGKLPLLHDHDPSLPAGRILQARLFVSPQGVRFIVTINLYYTEDKQESFAGVDLDTNFEVTPIRELDPLNEDAFIHFSANKKMVDSTWNEQLFSSAPLPIRRFDQALYSAEPVTQLITIGLPFAALLWNPFTTSVATETGKDLYLSLKQWVKRVIAEGCSSSNPILELKSLYSGCVITFLLRGKDKEVHYAAYDAISQASGHAHQLINKCKERGNQAVILTYEFVGARWIPSYLILENGQIVSDRHLLLAFERAPRGLSLGLAQRTM